MSDYQTILLERDEARGLAVLTFNRPEVRNALNQDMVDEVRHALNALRLDADLGALILTGAGDKAFIGGADIAELRDRRHLEALRGINSQLFGEIERFPAPTIAAIRGFALGGGCELAMACDLRVCGEGSKLGQPEVGLGIIPGAGATYRLPKLVGLGVARELIFTGKIVDAQEALKIGSSQLSVEAGQALESASQGILFDHEEKVRRMTAFLERKQARKHEVPGVEVQGAETQTFTFPDLAHLPDAHQVPDVGALVPGRAGRAVRIGALLERVGGDAPFVAVSTGDGKFRTSQPRETLAQALLVYALDGQPLPSGQGGPFRLLIPDGADACANIKQVARIEQAQQPTDDQCPHSPEEHARIKAKKQG